jgi:hypothetical protein
MSSNLLGELAANNGTYFLNNSGFDGNIDQIIVRGEGVVIAKIYVIRNGEPLDVVNEYLSTNNVPNGLRITPKNDEVFIGVDLGGAPNFSSGLELVLSA